MKKGEDPRLPLAVYLTYRVMKLGGEIDFEVLRKKLGLTGKKVRGLVWFARERKLVARKEEGAIVVTKKGEEFLKRIKLRELPDGSIAFRYGGFVYRVKLNKRVKFKKYPISLIKKFAEEGVIDEKQAKKFRSAMKLLKLLGALEKTEGGFKVSKQVVYGFLGY